jgi:hypothetical protein
LLPLSSEGNDTRAGDKLSSFVPAISQRIMGSEIAYGRRIGNLWISSRYRNLASPQRDLPREKSTSQGTNKHVFINKELQIRNESIPSSSRSSAQHTAFIITIIRSQNVLSTNILYLI